MGKFLIRFLKKSPEIRFGDVKRAENSFDYRRGNLSSLPIHPLLIHPSRLPLS